jgi:8-oxo-dGTP pyrophosphatase MutT (NUDIX family)
VWYDGTALSAPVPAVNIEHLLTRPDALAARVRAALARRAPVRRPVAAGVRRAAVLLLLVHMRGEAGLLLTQRSETVERHRGQISLPGGVVEPGESALEAALRETSEEIGVLPHDVTVLGALDDEETVVSGFALRPFVGALPYPYPLRPSPAEVTRVLEMPVRALLDPGNVRLERWDRGGEVRYVYVFTVGDDVVWGATARVMTQFLRVVFEATFPQPDGGTAAGPAPRTRG